MSWLYVNNLSWTQCRSNLTASLLLCKCDHLIPKLHQQKAAALIKDSFLSADSMFGSVPAMKNEKN